MKKLLFSIIILCLTVGFIGCKSEQISSYEGSSSSTLQNDEGKSTGKLQGDEDKSSRKLQNIHTLSAPSGNTCSKGTDYKPATRWTHTVKYKIVFPVGQSGGEYIDYHHGIIETINSNTACARVIDAANAWNDAFESEGISTSPFVRITAGTPDITIHLGVGRPGNHDTGVFGDTFATDAKGKEVDDVYFIQGPYNPSSGLGFLGVAIHELAHVLGLAHSGGSMSSSCSDALDTASSISKMGYPSDGDMCVLSNCLFYGSQW